MTVVAPAPTITRGMLIATADAFNHQGHTNMEHTTNSAGEGRPGPPAGAPPGLLPTLLISLGVPVSLLALLLMLAVAAAAYLPGLQMDQDAAALHTLLGHELPTRATLTMTRRILNGPAMARFVTAYGYDGPVENGPFVRVPAYDASLLDSQVYPSGSMFLVNVAQDWNRGIELSFYFDRRGRLLRCDAQGYYHFALG